jgi:LAGLIDADG DNA endonuclease family
VEVEGILGFNLYPKLAIRRAQRPGCTPPPEDLGGGKLDYNKNSKNKGVVLNTQSFEPKEVKTMAEQLSEKFDLDCEIRSKGKKVIVIKSSSYLTFLSLIDPYILPDMRYKLP